MLVAGAGAAVWFWHDLQESLDRRIYLHDSSELFEIPRGSSVRDLARRLEERGWLKRAFYLRFESRRTNIAGKLQAGLYEIRNGTTLRELLKRFVGGDVKVFQITFVEGTTFREMRMTLDAHRHLEHSDRINRRSDPARRLRARHRTPGRLVFSIDLLFF